MIQMKGLVVLACSMVPNKGSWFRSSPVLYVMVQARKVTSSGGSTQPTSDTQSTSAIVANLADLTKRLALPTAALYSCWDTRAS